MLISKKKIVFLFIGLVILLAGVFTAGIFVGKNQVVCKVCAPEKLDFSLFWDAYYKLSDSFIDRGKIDTQKIIYGAIDGMAKSLGDPYTSFFNPGQAKIFNQNLSGSFSGIGVEIGIKKDMLTVVAPLPDTPGQKAGLRAGDIILKIDGKDASNMSTDEAVSLIRGQKGTKVTLTIFREGLKAPKDISIIRETIKIPSVKWELFASTGGAGGKEGDIAYIHIYQFDQSLEPDFRKFAVSILSSPAKKIVLDLRNNPGGYLEVAQDIAGWFLQSGQIVTIEDFGKNKEQIQYKTKGNSTFANYPMVILINGGSASASEILAGALRDNRNIKLIGEKSFGKGSVQEVQNLRDGSFLKITIAKWLTPKGSLISEIGLSPDIKVEITDDNISQDKDPQLDKALEIIKTLQ
ncbi:MAG: S41 family peptidase [Patescibacteria group bacterium]